ncbi:hypothetical protein ACFYTS_06765 [Nocardia sp. NPDC004151]|uniref:hypothetical protein n=1 Tax=Nocardia sp. NPDC004151 TaxID=3364304 RepID=UPI0036C0A571
MEFGALGCTDFPNYFEMELINSLGRWAERFGRALDRRVSWMRTLIAAVGIATALTVGAGQAVAAPLPGLDTPATPVAATGSSTGSAGMVSALQFLSNLLACILPPSPGCYTGGDGSVIS